MVTMKLFNVRFSPHWKTTFRRCCEKLFIPLLMVLSFLGFSPDLQAQSDSPCECVQRWEKGAHWNEDGTINDAPNAPAPLGVIRCAPAAETQSQIHPNGCTYNPAEFTIDVSGSDCIDPSTGASVAVDNPTEGEPIIWFNFDARPHSSEFEVQINDNSGDRIGFALYYSATPTSGLNENGFSGDCSNLVLVACGVESSNTWNTLPVPDFDEPTNYYLAIWDQDADGDLKVNNFKARFGCSEGEDEPECALDLIECPETAEVSCGDPFDPVTLGILPETCNNIEVDYSDVIAGVCTDNLSIKRVWTFKDQSGNKSTCEQMLEFVDETAPTIEEIEDYVLEDCEAEWPALSTEWSDNCGSGGQVDGMPGEVMADGCTETLVYTFTVSDDCGNETITTTTVTRKLDALVVACPGDKTIEACASEEDINAAFTAFLEAFKIESGCNASGSLDAEYSAPDKCGGSVEVSYTATTDCGEPQTCTATFTVPECTTGECSDCPESCAISGNQEVCPNDMVTYTVEFEEGCENPEIIWSLNETYNDATIVAQDGNSVTLEIDNNCEGWVELIATIKCDGCEDLVCKYPIDVVLTDVVFETPENVVIDACTDAASIETAFDAFLEGFSVSGGCNAMGEFEKEYSLPEVCGGSVEVVYNAVADCGQVSSTSATFTIETCEDGSCDDCPESCAISGDQEVCPGELVTYTVAIPDGCENPEVIWSLNETYDNATIVGEDPATNSIVLKIDNDCEAWVELIATIKCDGCEDVVCTYPIDVVLTELVLNCPEDVVMEPCSSQEDIDAAFGEFLESFTFEGGCDAESAFETEYSAPDKCGGIVEVKYIVTESCGETKSCTATFSIDICEDGTCNTCEGSCLIDGKIAACPGEELIYTLSLEDTCEEPEVIWSLDGDAEIIEASEGQVTVKATEECEGWFTLTATINCENCPPVECETTVDIVRHKLVPECPEDVVVSECLTSSEVKTAFVEFLESFAFSGGCGDAYGDFAMEYEAPTACGESVTVEYIVQDDCGQYETCSATFSIENCGEGECDECPETCAISGDQEVCPGELVTYTVTIPDGCENPEVIWSLNETYNDATIVGEDPTTNSIVLKIDNNCEAWVELIATIKCDGCEDVVCTYPIDAVLTDVVLDCPEDVVMEPCSSQEDIDAAFAEFLESFAFEGGCDAEGAFETEYSAPNKCGGIVEVKYIVTESCGATKSCSVTFSIDICEDGTCNTCEGSCLIDGKIAACPGEELVYTLDLDGICAEPEIMWTLDGDAEILEASEGQVTVKATEECEGWFTLTATINCENCPPVECEKTVDIVRHKIVPECPDDMVVEACLTESEVNAAFEEFLNSFDFSGGCGDAFADFAMEYAAPAACGESVTVEYIVQDNCGQYEVCTATFSIKDCDQECTPEIEDLEDIVLEACGAEWPTLETQWWDDCGNDGKVVGEPGEVMTIDDCYQYRIYTFTIYNACGEDAQTTTKVTRRYDETAPIVPIPNLNIDLVTCIDDIPSPEGLEALIELSLLDNCDESPDIIISAEGSPECIDGSFSYTYSVKVCDECGNCDEIAVTYSGTCNGTPGEAQTFCTLTQGGWGNPGGKYPWKDGEKAGTEEIITALMEINGDLIIGDTLANVLRITDPECVLSLLPGGGTPDVLPEGDVSASSENDCTPYSEEYLTGSGRLENNLAAQAIALQLNSWYTFEVSGSELGALSLETLSLEGTDILPDTVTNVQELLEFTNLYLGGTVESENDLASPLTELLASLNEFFDGCSEVAYDECGLAIGLLDDLDLGLEDDAPKEEEEESEEQGILEMELEKPFKVWPNPASKHLTLEFESEEEGETRVRLIDPSGKRVFDRTFPVTIGDNNLIIPIDGFPAGIYTIMTVQDDRQLLERIVITKR